MGTEHDTQAIAGNRPEDSVTPYSAPGTIIRKLTITEVRDLLLAELKADMEEVCRETRKREVVKWRQTMMHLMKWYGFTSIAIGAMFGKDHATVLSGVKRVDDDMRSDRDLRDFVIKMKHTVLRKNIYLFTIHEITVVDRAKQEKLTVIHQVSDFTRREDLNNYLLEVKLDKEEYYGIPVDIHLRYTETSNLVI
jgi:hypothetical protein